QAELTDWQQLLETRRDWLSRRGIKYLFVIPPDKHSIYPEYLPKWLAKRASQTKLDQFFAHMKAHSSVPVVDLRPPLEHAKKTTGVYLCTDSHWNTFGGFVGYRSTILALANQMPGLEPLLYEAFDWKAKPTPGGDLANMLGQASQMLETNAVQCLPL